ncbi:hypothetical protein ACLMAB_11450 [Brevibacillus laterosporus]
MELKLMASPKRLKAPSTPSVEKTLTSTEQSAIEYITVMQNGQDTELKKKFVAEKITSEVCPLFEMATKYPSAKSAILDNGTVVKSVDYEMGGKKATAVLIVGDKESEKSVEEIVLVSDGKVGWVHTKADSLSSSISSEGYLTVSYNLATPLTVRNSPPFSDTSRHT